ncbi:glutamate-rich WD repeat domain-containing protein, partial [Haematococcus lacustris]
MRNPKKGGKPAPKPKAAGSGKKSKKDAKPQLMETDTQANTKSVWRPGVDPVGEDEELDYDRTAYDCLHRLELDWPCL